MCTGVTLRDANHSKKVIPSSRFFKSLDSVKEKVSVSGACLSRI